MHKDIAIAIFGASVGMAGLLLVFAGYLFAHATTFPTATTDDDIIEKYRNAGRFGVWPFLLSMGNAALALMWMIWPDPLLFKAAVVCFINKLLTTKS